MDGTEEAEVGGEKKPVKRETIPGRIEKTVKKIAETVNDVKAKLETYEVVSGAQEEIEREEKKAREAEIAAAIKAKSPEAGETDKDKERQPSIPEKGGDDPADDKIFGGLGIFE